MFTVFFFLIKSISSDHLLFVTCPDPKVDRNQILFQGKINNPVPTTNNRTMNTCHSLQRPASHSHSNLTPGGIEIDHPEIRIYNVEENQR